MAAEFVNTSPEYHPGFIEYNHLYQVLTQPKTCQHTKARSSA